MEVWRRIRAFLVPRPHPDPSIKKRGFGWGWLVAISLLAATLHLVDTPLAKRDMDIAMIISLPFSALIYFLIRKRIIERGRYAGEIWPGSLWAGILTQVLGAMMAGLIAGFMGPPDPARTNSMPGFSEAVLILLIIAIVVGPAVVAILLSRRFKKSRKERLSKEPSTAPFATPEARGKWAKGLLIATLAMATLAAVSGVLQIDLLSRIARGFGYTMDEAFRNDSRQQVLGILQLLLVIATTVIFLMWFHRVYKNLPSLGQRRPTFTPGWAVGFFFVPFLNLVRPFQAMREAWHGSDPGRLEPDVPSDGSEKRDRPATPPLVGWWWGLCLISGVVSNIVGRIYFYASKNGTLAEAQTASVLMVVSDLLSIPGALVTIRLVGRLTRRQAEKVRLISERGGPAAMAPTASRDSAGLTEAVPAGIESPASAQMIKRSGRKKTLAWGATAIAVPILAISVFLLTRDGVRKGEAGGVSDEGQYLTVGSTQEEVLRIQGPPTYKLEMVWFYEDSQVQFDSDGKVSSIRNVSKNLKIKPEKQP
ncbi:MAG TPA: DUF4328 domain-containing protein [Acidobacteriota bacterium]|nr:DUF4328 domain-containing protein [Acidobacteriota bacterium]